MLTTKEVTDYFRMFEPLIKARIHASVYLSFDILNPTDIPEQGSSFTLSQDLIHVIGVIDTGGRKYEVRILDPYEFTQDKAILSVEEVPEFTMKASFSLNLTNGRVDYFA